MKKLLNSVEDAVYEMGAGIAMVHRGLVFNPRYTYLRKKDIERSKVSLVSGGGSGHEPAHAGYICKGMLDAVVCGDVFASPSQIQVYEAIKDSAGNRGTLLIIKNYSGDIMNFQNAAFLAGMDGLTVDYIKVCDDIAVEGSLYTVGRRGVAGTVLVHKIAGAAAEAGGSLVEVKRLAQKAADSVRSLGFALSPCTVPAKGSPTFSLGEDEMEYGIGIHGEPGIRREKTAPARELAKRMVPALVADLSLPRGVEAALLVNGFGATPLMELYILAYSALAELSQAGIKTYRVSVGNYMTSLEMAGASLSLLKLDGELKGLLDAPSDAPSFTVLGGGVPESARSESFLSSDFFPARVREKGLRVSYKAETDAAFGIIGAEGITLNNIIYLVDTMSELIIENERAFRGVQETGKRSFGRGADIGDKTLADALIPCAQAWNAAAEEGASFPAAFRAGAEAAATGAEGTKNIVARMGRAEHAGERTLGYPDAGAYALGIIFTEIAKRVSP